MAATGSRCMFHCVEHSGQEHLVKKTTLTRFLNRWKRRIYGSLYVNSVVDYKPFTEPGENSSFIVLHQFSALETKYVIIHYN